MKMLLTKNIAITFALAVTVAGIVGCGGAGGNDTGSAYMPDMYYSRAYEAYGYNNMPEDHDLKSRGAFFNGTPVAGTVARGDVFSFPVPGGDSGYALAASYQPAPEVKTMTPAQLKEGERLYLINCGICHGPKLDGQGPLFNNGNGPYPVAPPNLTDQLRKALSDGQYYHVITYGKGQMGSYASQLHPQQRWWVINYIRGKQGPAVDSLKAGSGTAAAATGTDTTTTNSK